MLKHQLWKISNIHMYPKHRYGMKVEVNNWCDYNCICLKLNVLQWINMVRVIEYHFVSLHEFFKCTIGNNVEI
jgi:hypothetical protein